LPDPVRDPTANFDFLVLPGLGNSGVDHWQSYWCMALRNATRVVQDEWDKPALASWLNRLDAALANGTRPAILICHSLSCTLAAHWARRGQPGRVKAALLVAPSDLERPDAPAATRDFLPMPRQRFPVPTLVVASMDDTFVKPVRGLLRVAGSRAHQQRIAARHVAAGAAAAVVRAPAFSKFAGAHRLDKS